MTVDRAVTISLAVVGTVVGGLIALFSAFFIPTRAAFVSLGDLLALVAVGGYAHLVGRAARSTGIGTLPALGWLAVTMYLATMRPEGDLVVTGDPYGLLYLLLGTVSGAVGIGTIRAAVRRDERRAAARAEQPGEAVVEAAG